MPRTKNALPSKVQARIRVAARTLVLITHGAHLWQYNPKYENLWAADEGLKNPYYVNGITPGMRNTLGGFSPSCPSSLTLLLSFPPPLPPPPVDVCVRACIMCERRTGSLDPSALHAIITAPKQTPFRSIERTNLVDLHFEDQIQTFDTFGYAVDPAAASDARLGSYVVGDRAMWATMQGRSAQQATKRDAKKCKLQDTAAEKASNPCPQPSALSPQR